MAYRIYLGTANKRINSTLRWDYSGGDSFDIVFKRDTDLDFPVFVLEYSGTPAWNVMYIAETSGYYWLTNIRSVRAGVWEVSAAMDVLATFKTEIMATPCYIEYGKNADASGAQTRLPDTRQNVSQVPQVFTASADITGGNINVQYGTYILAAVGAKGGVAAYAVNAVNIKKLLDSVNTTIQDALADKSTVADILKYFSENSIAQGSAIQAIRSCVWIPVSGTVFLDLPVQKIFLGDFDTGVVGRVLSERPVKVYTTTINIPWPAEDWKRMNCQMLLYLPFIGTVSVPVDQCNNVAALTVTLSLECITGGISVKVDAGSYTVYAGSGNIGVPYAIGSSNVPIQNTIAGTVSATAGALSVGGGLATFMAGGVRDVASGMGQMASGVIQTLQPVVQCAGTLGGSAAIGQTMQATLCLLYYAPLNDDAFQAAYGFPVMRMGTPVAGFCKTRGFSLAAPARLEELQQVGAFMDSGVFIE